MKAKSKKLSYILRHQDTKAILPGGWIPVDLALGEVGISMDELKKIVSQNDKGRYELSSNNTLIRALYGHSVEVDLDYVPLTPPDILFHGTAMKSYTSIIENGIMSRNRQFVHLSEDKETAISVGQRHGNPIVLEIDASKMLQDGCVFYNPKEGIWLTDLVKPEYILNRI